MGYMSSCHWRGGIFFIKNKSAAITQKPFSEYDVIIKIIITVADWEMSFAGE